MLLCAKLIEYIIALFEKKSKGKSDKRNKFVNLHKCQCQSNLQTIKAAHICEQLFAQFLYLALSNR